VSVGGKRLYELARRGKAVEAPLREVQITRLELERWQPPEATLLVECSKGTYIRSLAHDLGAALEVGGHLTNLVRLRVGQFTLERSVPLSDLEERLRGGDWQSVAIAPDEAVEHLPLVQVDAAAAGRLANGGVLDIGPAGEGATEELVRVHGAAGRFLAIGRRTLQGGRVVLRPEKVFAAPASP
jgi:tRNA pseudouridine55 synthase